MVVKINKLHIFSFFCVLILISFIFALSSEKAVVTTSSETSVKLPVVMYHHITTDDKKAGPYTVTTQEFENDLLYLKSKGYETVTIDDLLNYVNTGGALPQKPIMITFDDGFESFYGYAFPLLKEHNMKAVLSVIGYTVDKYSLIDEHNLDYSNLTWSQLKTVHASGLVEIGNHTYNLHDNEKGSRKGMSQIKGEDNFVYQGVVTNDLLKLQDLLFKNLGKSANVIAYPYGAYNKLTSEIIKDLGFTASFTCEERINTITKFKPECLYNLGRYNRYSGVSSSDFFDKIIEK